MVRVETRAWELNHDGAESELPKEIADATARLESHPFAGVRLRNRRGHVRKLHLRRTGFVMVYRVHTRLRIVAIIGLYSKASLAYRR